MKLFLVCWSDKRCFHNKHLVVAASEDSAKAIMLAKYNGEGENGIRLFTDIRELDISRPGTLNVPLNVF